MRESESALVTIWIRNGWRRLRGRQPVRERRFEMVVEAIAEGHVDDPVDLCRFAISHRGLR